MSRIFLFLFASAMLLGAEVYRMTLPEALKRASEQGPDILLSRFDELNAQLGVQVAKDPFSPKLYVGSGLAYTYGFPMSIEGSAPSIFQVKTVQTLINRPQSYMLAKAKVEARGANQVTLQKRDEVFEKTAKLYLDADRAGRNLKLLSGQVENLEAVSGTIGARVEEGFASSLDLRRAEVNLRKAKQRISVLKEELRQTQHMLAFVLGYDSQDRVEAELPEGFQLSVPANEDSAIREALDSSRELKKLQSDLQAKNLELRANRSAWLPQMDLVAQYGLFSKFNNFDVYFNRFQRNNLTLGVSFKFPVIPGAASGAQAMQATNDAKKLQLQVTNARNRIELETRRLYQDLALHKENRDVARLDLEVAQDQIRVLLAQMEEGKITKRQLEEARYLEGEKWMAYWDAQYLFERAKVAILAATGGIGTLAENRQP